MTLTLHKCFKNVRKEEIHTEKKYTGRSVVGIWPQGLSYIVAIETLIIYVPSTGMKNTCHIHVC